MIIKTRKVTKYLDVYVSEGSTNIDLGLLNQDEAKLLRQALLETIDELNEFIGEE